MKFNKDIETLKWTQAEMKMELENPIRPTKSSKETYISRMNQVEDRVLGYEKKINDLDQICRNIFLKWERNP